MPNLRESGYTLFELMLSFLITATLSYSTLLTLPKVRDSFMRSSGKETLESILLKAKSKTLYLGGHGFLSASLDGTALSYGIDYPPYNVPAQEDSLVFVDNLPNGVTISTASQIIFSSQGFLTDSNGVFTQVDYTLAYKEQPYCVGTVYSLGVTGNGCR